MIVKLTQIEVIATIGAFLLLNACGQKAAFDETPVQAQIGTAADSEAARQGTTNATIRSASAGDSGNLGSTTGETTTGGNTTGNNPTPTPTPQPTPTPAAPVPAPVGDEPAEHSDPASNGADTGDSTDGGDTSGTTDDGETSGTAGGGDTSGATDGSTADDDDDDAASGGDGSGAEDLRDEVEATCSNKGKTGKYHTAGNSISEIQNLDAQPGDLIYVKLSGKNITWDLNINNGSIELANFDKLSEVYVCVVLTGSSNTFNLVTDIDTVLEVKHLGDPRSHTYTFVENGDAKVTVIDHPHPGRGHR